MERTVKQTEWLNTFHSGIAGWTATKGRLLQMCTSWWKTIPHDLISTARLQYQIDCDPFSLLADPLATIAYQLDIRKSENVYNWPNWICSVTVVSNENISQDNYNDDRFSWTQLDPDSLNVTHWSLNFLSQRRCLNYLPCQLIPYHLLWLIYV